MRRTWKSPFFLVALFAMTIYSANALTRDVPFVPTPQAVVDEMLALANVGPDTVLYDLGSGDGRIVITAAREYGARGVGVDIDPQRIAESQANARAAGVEAKVQFVEGDLFEIDLRSATAVTLYLLPQINLKLRPKLLKELRPGTPVVSHAFDMDEWEPEVAVSVGTSHIYMWRIPARAAGTWEYRVAMPDRRLEKHRLEVSQHLQTLRGTVAIDGVSFPVQNGRVNGEEVSFTIERPLNRGKVTQRFRGRVINGQVAGMALIDDAAVARHANTAVSSE